VCVCFRAIRGIAIARFVLLRNLPISAESSGRSQSVRNAIHQYQQHVSSFQSDGSAAGTGSSSKSALDLFALPEWLSFEGQRAASTSDPEGRSICIGLLLRTCRPGILEGEETGKDFQGSDYDYVAPRS